MGLVLGHMTASFVVGSVVDQPILVGAAGLIVILAILLVFVMVLRSGGRREVGIGLDGHQGPLGQPKAPPSQPRSFGANMFDAQGYAARTRQPSADYGALSQQPADASGWNANYQNPQVPWGQPPASQAPAVPPWGADQQPAPWGQQQDQNNWAPAQSPAMPAAPWGQQAESGGWSNAPSAQGYGMPAQPVPVQGGGWTGAASPNGASASDDRAAFAFGGFDATRSARPASSPGSGFGGAGRGSMGGNMERAVLVVRKGKDVGHVFEVGTDRTTIGRSRDSDIFLEDLAVSRTHTSITRDNQGRYILRDEDSANGTLVNGEPVKGPIILQFGDEVQVGQTVMTFSRR